MGEEAGKLIGAIFLIVAALYVAALIIAAAVVIAAILAPPVATGYWLRYLLSQRYQIGPRKTLECVLAGIAMAALSWLPPGLSPSPTSEWTTAAAVWMSIIGGLLGFGLYLSLSVYHDVFWPRRKAIIKAASECLKLRYELCRQDFQSSRLHARVRRVEERHGARLMEIRQLEQSVSEVVRTTDPAFLSSERARWEIECSSLDTNALERRLDSVRHEITQTGRSSPYFASLVVQAGVLRLSVQKRQVGTGAGASYEADTREWERFRSSTGALRQRLNVLQQQETEARSSLRQLRRQRLFVQ